MAGNRRNSSGGPERDPGTGLVQQFQQRRNSLKHSSKSLSQADDDIRLNNGSKVVSEGSVGSVVMSPKSRRPSSTSRASSLSNSRSASLSGSDSEMVVTPTTAAPTPRSGVGDFTPTGGSSTASSAHRRYQYGKHGSCGTIINTPASVPSPAGRHASFASGMSSPSRSNHRLLEHGATDRSYKVVSDFLRPQDAVSPEFSLFHKDMTSLPELQALVKDFLSNLDMLSESLQDTLKDLVCKIVNTCAVTTWQQLENARQQQEQAKIAKDRADKLISANKKMQVKYLKEVTLLRDQLNCSRTFSCQPHIELWEPMHDLDDETRDLVTACVEEKLKTQLLDVNQKEAQLNEELAEVLVQLDNVKGQLHKEQVLREELQAEIEARPTGKCSTRNSLSMRRSINGSVFGFVGESADVGLRRNSKLMQELMCMTESKRNSTHERVGSMPDSLLPEGFRMNSLLLERQGSKQSASRQSPGIEEIVASPEFSSECELSTWAESLGLACESKGKRLVTSTAETRVASPQSPRVPKKRSDNYRETWQSCRKHMTGLATEPYNEDSMVLPCTEFRLSDDDEDDSDDQRASVPQSAQPAVSRNVASRVGWRGAGLLSSGKAGIGWRKPASQAGNVVLGVGAAIERQKVAKEDSVECPRNHVRRTASPSTPSQRRTALHRKTDGEGFVALRAETPGSPFARPATQQRSITPRPATRTQWYAI